MKKMQAGCGKCNKIKANFKIKSGYQLEAGRLCCCSCNPSGVTFLFRDHHTSFQHLVPIQVAEGGLHSTRKVGLQFQHHWVVGGSKQQHFMCSDGSALGIIICGASNLGSPQLLKPAHLYLLSGSKPHWTKWTLSFSRSVQNCATSSALPLSTNWMSSSGVQTRYVVREIFTHN